MQDTQAALENRVQSHFPVFHVQELALGLCTANLGQHYSTWPPHAWPGSNPAATAHTGKHWRGHNTRRHVA